MADPPKVLCYSCQAPEPQIIVLLGASITYVCGCECLKKLRDRYLPVVEEAARCVS